MSSNSPSQNGGSPPNTGFHSDHLQGPPRKKMRKGTKSCLECRRRKIKCTFEAGRTQICNECYARGSTCIDQEHGDIQSYTQQAVEQSSYSLRERVTQLEGMIKQVLHRLPEGQDQEDGSPQTDRSQVDAQAAEVLKSLKTSQGPTSPSAAEDHNIFLPGGVRSEAPALTLFDNAVIERKDSQPTLSRSQYNKNKTLIAALTQILPSPRDLEIILDWSHEWWVIWRKMFPEISDNRCETMKESVSHSLRSDKPAEIGKIMLCIAISIHQMPDGFDWSRLHLKESRSQLMDKYNSTVDKLIVCDDEIAATVEGIECMVLEAKYLVNMGRPRRAWLLFHRAIAFGQLLGFHRLVSQPDKSGLEFKRQYSIWAHLIIGDRFLALLLGIPYSVPDSFCAPLVNSAYSKSVVANDGETYLFRILPIVTKIVDRNQSPSPLAYSATMRLDQELEELHSAQDPSWWTTEKMPDQSVEDHFDRLQAQLFHHQVKVLLHMPFMLRSSSNDKRYQYSHTSALDGARNMIRYYDALRTNKSVGPYICKLIDFQAFTASMLLLLNLCGYSSANRGAQQHPNDLEQDQQDSELIDTTISLLHDASKEVGGVVAAQSAQALEMLAKIRQGVDGKAMEKCEQSTCQISIPYFGTISIGVGKSFVPIKPGTYPRPGQARPINSTVAAGGMNPSGLPTPPSVTSGGSTLPSPMSSTIDNYRAKRLPQYESTDFIAPGLDQPWNDEVDPFVTFDSFMALPTQNLPMDWPTSGSTNSGSGFTPQAYSATPENMPGNINGMGGIGVGAGTQNGFPFGGFPFNQGNSNVDLDQGWNWFGVDAPIIQ